MTPEPAAGVEAGKQREIESKEVKKHMEIVEATMKLYLTTLKWLGVALVAVVAVQFGTGYVSSTLEIPYGQALTLVIGLPALWLVRNWHPEGRRLRPTGRDRGRHHRR